MDLRTLVNTVFTITVVSGGGSDLLDYLPPGDYWQARGVRMTVERMVAEARSDGPSGAPRLIRELGAEAFQTREGATRRLRAMGAAAAPALERAAKADDPEVRERAQAILKDLGQVGSQGQAVWRLMAIRALGELRRREALPALRPVLGSEELFVAEYAREAMAAIEGKPSPRPRPLKAARWQDLCLLPASCARAVQMTSVAHGRVALDKVMQEAGAFAPAGVDAQTAHAEAVKVLTDLVERTGNVRIQYLTCAASEDAEWDEVGEGYHLLIARGRFNAAALKTALVRAGASATVQDGIPLLVAEELLGFMPCSNDLFIFALADLRDLTHPGVPTRELIAAFKQGRKQPALRGKLLDLVRNADIEAPLWGAACVTPALRRIPLLTPLDTIVLTSKPGPKGSLLLTLTARDIEGGVLETNAEVLKGVVLSGARQLRHQAAQKPLLSPIADFLDSVRVAKQGRTLTMTGTLPAGWGRFAIPAAVFPERGEDADADQDR